MGIMIFSTFTILSLDPSFQNSQSELFSLWLYKQVLQLAIVSLTFKLFKGWCSLRGFNPFAFWIRDLNHQNVLIQPLTGRGLILQCIAYFQSDSAFTLQKKILVVFCQILSNLSRFSPTWNANARYCTKHVALLLQGPFGEHLMCCLD